MRLRTAGMVVGALLTLMMNDRSCLILLLVFHEKEFLPCIEELSCEVSCCNGLISLHLTAHLLGLLLLQKQPNLSGALMKSPLRRKLKEIS
jgi:hypothetical protein